MSESGWVRWLWLQHDDFLERCSADESITFRPNAHVYLKDGVR